MCSGSKSRQRYIYIQRYIYLYILPEKERVIDIGSVGVVGLQAGRNVWQRAPSEGFWRECHRTQTHNYMRYLTADRNHSESAIVYSSPFSGEINVLLVGFEPWTYFTIL